MKILNREKVKKILVISLSNIGDVILTFPVIDILRRDFDQADLSVMIGPKGKALLIDNPKIDHLYVYEKKMSIKNKWRWLSQLRREKFDVVIDLRHSLFPLFLLPRYHTPYVRHCLPNEHVRDQHLRFLYAVYPADVSKERFSFHPNDEDRLFIDEALRPYLQPEDQIAVIAPGAADHRKRWLEESFARVADRLVQDHGLKIVFIGDETDTAIVSRIQARMHMSSIDLSAKTTFPQSGYLMSRAQVVLVNDSAPMHMASYIGVPVVALFGPTDPVKYGPWGDWSGFIHHNEDCIACQEKDSLAEHTCMESIAVDEVVLMAERLLNHQF